MGILGFVRILCKFLTPFFPASYAYCPFDTSACVIDGHKIPYPMFIANGVTKFLEVRRAEDIDNIPTPCFEQVVDFLIVMLDSEISNVLL